MSKLQDELERDYAPAWEPDEGDSLIGTVVDVTERDGAYGAYPIVTLRTEAGDELAVHAFHEVLQGELAKVAPKPGDELGIRYVGKHPERGYHRYRVRRAGSTADVSWARYGGADAEHQEGVPIGEDDAATEAALAAERDERDAIVSQAQAPLEETA